MPELNGVRGIAILLVLLYHFGTRPPGVPRVLTAPFALGWSGVDLFFALSGFLITGILLDTKPASNYFSSFYTRRVLRIFPLYLSAVAAFFLIALPVAHHFGYLSDANASLQVWYWCHVSNWQSAFGRDVGLLTHFWSLAIEEQFYLVWPVAVYLTPRSRMVHLCCAVIGAALALRIAFSGYLPEYPQLLVRLTPFRLDSLAFGGLAATIVREARWSEWVAPRARLIGAVALTVFLALLAVSGTHHPTSRSAATIGYSLLAVAFSCFVLLAYVRAGSSGWVGRVLRGRFLVALGKYSYGIYVLHFPIAHYQGRLVMALVQGWPAWAQVALWAGSKIVGVAISYGVAVVSWNVLEERFLKLKKRFDANVAPLAVSDRMRMPGT